MYPIEEMIAWEAAMADMISAEQQTLLKYKLMVRDLLLRRDVFLQQEEHDETALRELDEALAFIEILIEKKQIAIQHKHEQVEHFYSEWRESAVQNI
ncbi:hypothetical protein [Aneurinibacillus terranovensis]|uniref:hypothetical protein n=1 Tax=Aneurinibacillus terranovensis TaxID=278991 RepID=UPI00041A078E|nr:hypothetical protein [Aneurinibacillus terranovensis]